MNRPLEYFTEYQGVKEFHMLAGIGCYCKIIVFSPFKLKSHIITHPRVTNDDALLTSESPLNAL